MEKYYTLIGMTVVIITSGAFIGLSAWLVLAYVLEFFAKRVNSMWRVVEYAYYHKQFKKWMKDHNKKSVTGRF